MKSKIKKNTLKFNIVAMLFLAIVLIFSCRNAATKPTLKVCFLDYNEPLSNELSDKTRPGIYVEIAKLLAKELGRSLEAFYIKGAFYNRPIRNGLLSEKCDCQFGLPRTEGKWYIPRKVLLSDSFMEVGYSLVVPKHSSIHDFSSLKNKKIAVQSGSPPHESLMGVEGVELHFFKLAENALEALHSKKVDAAFVWGAVAGFKNKEQYSEQYKVIPSEYQWAVSIGVRGDDSSLVEELNIALGTLSDEIELIKNDFGYPKGEKIIMPKLMYYDK
ncbi:MAG: hypothetical protein COB98_11085 [Flavobacteriaceae bacterium]|nr:MAG: hypothetical protein COB98_11085 [Flavobacteriaceae bacterium]